MLAADKRMEKRNQVNSIWVGHKGMALERYCAVFSGSQSNTLRTGKDVGVGNWAEDIGKVAEIDKGVALNQTDEEKLQGIMRISKVADRHEAYNASTDVVVLQCLAIGNPMLDSHIKRKGE